MSEEFDGARNVLRAAPRVSYGKIACFRRNMQSSFTLVRRTAIFAYGLATAFNADRSVAVAG
jgi:hypothetical protein